MVLVAASQDHLCHTWSTASVHGFFSCVCVWINVLRRGKLVLPNTLHQPNWLDPLPHTRMALVRIPARQLEMPIFFLRVPTRGVPMSSTQTRHHMYHIWLSAPSTPHHFQLLRPLLDKRRRRQLPTTPLFTAGSARPPPTPASR